MNLFKLNLKNFYNKKDLLIFFLISFLFVIFILITKNNYIINGDTSNFIEYFWRLENNQIPHKDFRSPFGPSLAFFYFTGDFLNNLFLNNKSNIFDVLIISKLILAIIFFKISFYLSLNIFEENKKKIFISFLISLYISSYIITSRAFGNFSLQSATSFYNSYILSYFFITILYLIYVVFTFNFKKKSYHQISYLSLYLGFFLSSLVFLKITAVILFFPIVCTFYILRRENYIERIFTYFLIGVISYFLIVLFYLNFDGFYLYLKENLNYLNIFSEKFLSSSNDYTNEFLLSNNFLKINLFLKSLLDIFCLLLIFLLNKNLNFYKNYFYKKKINLFLFLLIYFLVSFFLQITSEQYPESNIGAFMIILILIFSKNFKLNLIQKSVLFFSMLYPIFILYKNLLLPLLISMHSIFGIYDVIDKQEHEFYNKNRNYNLVERILLTEKKLQIEIENINKNTLIINDHSFLFNNKKISNVGCAIPISFLSKSVPPKNSNLYWHYGVTFNENYHNFNSNDETEIFIMCGKSADNYNLSEFNERKILSQNVLILNK